MKKLLLLLLVVALAVPATAQITPARAKAMLKAKGYDTDAKILAALADWVDERNRQCPRFVDEEAPGEGSDLIATKYVLDKARKMLVIHLTAKANGISRYLSQSQSVRRHLWQAAIDLQEYDDDLAEYTRSSILLMANKYSLELKVTAPPATKVHTVNVTPAEIEEEFNDWYEEISDGPGWDLPLPPSTR